MRKLLYNIMTGAITMLVMAAMLTACSANKATHALHEWEQLDGDVTLYLANDLGRNGYYYQKSIAELMGKMAETVSPECVIAAGDIHHFNGVSSVDDPLWTTNYELVYSHPELMIEWLPILGNHEYRGNTQAVLDYTDVSRRWCMSARYYTRVFTADSLSVRVVFVDTTPMINRYRVDTDKYPDAGAQDLEAQLQWIDATLAAADEDWIIVVGHHPIFADTPKEEVERTDMQNTLLPVLRKNGNVAIYACGHIHNFQHIKIDGDATDYVVNSSASLSRGEVSPVEGTVYCSPEPGFSVITATKDVLRLHMIDKDGNILHTVSKGKEV